ncbi:DUF1876 domain-containing protein [Streptomyces purpureus]|uniref:DUF1876 domain-containing protein n=1 Tax=Streptomyces purpureus TaxID=1951 RepID=A0A918GWI3_9ACTN|nr:DUF1876 domain-containing protein [Streptomyces purpureus]GGT13489.1 hypothetical protein GCM10014713_02550 [Streptomyces purpureus]
MTRTHQWTVGLNLVEEDGTTKAQAELDTGTSTLTGKGTARCNPSDVDIPAIGDELAASRAMKDLATQLMRAADRDMEAAGAVTAPTQEGTEYGWSDTAK